MPFKFPKVYPILDSSCIPIAGRADFLCRMGSSLADAGVTLLEYRNKTGSDAEILADASVLRSAMPNIKLILDDRVDLIEQLGFDGVHVDAGDLSPAAARRQLGSHRIIGTFGGSDRLLPGILDEPADYFSIGPVFPTTTKQTSNPPIGLEGVRRLRATSGPEPVLVAAAGITLATAQSVLDAGASMVAVSAAIFRPSDPAAEVRRWIETLK
ncbi:MAG TPA: thiamine phosphate synthase [Terracidiphilus sp.]|nr:thiamine phosphate synthase [Terracidiphilus sp.]